LALRTTAYSQKSPLITTIRRRRRRRGREEEITQSNRDAQDTNRLFASCYYERSKQMITRFVFATNKTYEHYSFYTVTHLPTMI
jgi:hypothetical protein